MEKYIASLDFDGTLRVDNMENEAIELLSALPNNIITAINTGRGIGILQDKVKHYFPQHYKKFMDSINYFICNNGTDIYYKVNDNFSILQEWSLHLQDQWPKKEILNILTPLADKLNFELYPEEYNYKLLYYFLRPGFKEAELAIVKYRKALSQYPVNLVYAESSQAAPEGLKRFVCEIFPKKAGKGNALLFLKNHLESADYKIKNIACFGDDRNDLQTVVDMPLNYDWWYGCLVGNSTEWILEKANIANPNLKGKILIAPSKYPGPAGITWILKELNWL